MGCGGWGGDGMRYGFWDRVFGIGCLGYGVWDMVFGVLYGAWLSIPLCDRGYSGSYKWFSLQGQCIC